MWKKRNKTDVQAKANRIEIIIAQLVGGSEEQNVCLKNSLGEGERKRKENNNHSNWQHSNEYTIFDLDFRYSISFQVQLSFVTESSFTFLVSKFAWFCSFILDDINRLNVIQQIGLYGLIFSKKEKENIILAINRKSFTLLVPFR